MATTPIVPLTQPIAEVLNHANGTGSSVRPDAPDDGRAVSEEEYWALWYDHPDASYEWNDGYLEAKPSSNQIQFRLYKWFLILLEHHLQAYQTGQMMGLETGFSMTVPSLKLPGQSKKTVRKPDIAVIRYDNRLLWGETERSYRGICDLCIESLSDSTKGEVERDTKVKKIEYEFAGVQEYYILDPSATHMRFYQRAPAGHYSEIAPDAEGVIRSLVLPGFQFRLRDLYRLPTLETLALDEVYQGYMLLHYQAALIQSEVERRRTQEEYQRAEAERRRAQEEYQRAEAERRRAQEEYQRAEQEAVARRMAEVQAAAATQAQQTAEAEIIQLRAELARLRAATP